MGRDARHTGGFWARHYDDLAAWRQAISRRHRCVDPVGGRVWIRLVLVDGVLATMFPPDVATVGQLAKATLARNYQPIVAESKKSATDAEVWDMLSRIIGEQLAVRPNKLTKGMSF